MLKLYYGFCFATLIFLSSCTKWESVETLRNNNFINEHFSEAEIAKFMTILDFVDQSVAEIENKAQTEEDLEEAYRQYFKRIIKSTKVDSKENMIFFDKKKMDQMIRSIPIELLNGIFGRAREKHQVAITKNNELVDSTFYIVSLRTIRTERMDVLFDHLSQDHNAVKSLMHKNQKVREYDPSLFQTEVIGNWDALNFKDVRFRLFCSFFLIAWNDEMSQLSGDL